MKKVFDGRTKKIFPLIFNNWLSLYGLEMYWELLSTKQKKKILSIYRRNEYRTTALNTVLSPNFLAWKFSGNAQFLQRISRNYGETVCFHKIPHSEIRQNFGISCGGYFSKLDLSEFLIGFSYLISGMEIPSV